jgi:hypothetical protein
MMVSTVLKTCLVGLETRRINSQSFTGLKTSTEMAKKLNVYISGKVTGLDYEKAFRKFEFYERILTSFGLDSVNPMKLNIPEETDWDDAMKTCLEVQKNDCNAILLIHDWKSSKGAKEEFKQASELNHTIYFYNKLNEIDFDVTNNVVC